MKKIFFLKSTSSLGSEHHDNSAATRGKKLQPALIRHKTVGSQNVNNKYRNSENFFPVADKKVDETKTISRHSVLRRSQTLSTSSAAIDNTRFNEEDFTRLRNQQRFSSSHGECDCSDCHFQFRDRDSKPEILCHHASSSTSNPSSPQTSFGSTSISGQVLDLYMDGDHHQENFRIKDNRRRGVHNRVFSDSNLLNRSRRASRDSLRSEHRPESPRKLAKHVVEKLLRLEQFRDLNPNELCSNWPPMPTKVSDKHLDVQINPLEDNMQRNCCTLKDVLDQDTFAVNNHSFLFEREYSNIFPDRRSDEWESKLRVFDSEEKRLKDRLKEVAEHNVSLQREISAFYDKERDYKDRLSQMEANLKDLMDKLDETRSENDSLQKIVSDVKDKLEISEEIQSCMERNIKEQEKENTELKKKSSRLRGMFSEQERTIDGLRQSLNSEIERRQISGKIQNVTHKLQVEQSRLAEVEQILRRKLESCTVEVQSLRNENIYLLERLKGTGEVGGRSGLKLDKELVSCVQCLQKMGLSLLNESVQACEEMLRIIGRENRPNGIQEAHTVIQYDMKVQGFKQGLEELRINLGKTGSILTKKDELNDHKPESCENDNQKSKNLDRVVVEGDLISELRAESLLTSILKEKLYCKEKEIEGVQAELTRALQSHDVLKSEIQDAFDTVSCLNHKMKNFELQMIEKDGTINQLQGEVQSREEDLGSIRRTLSKVSQERDLMWEEVKRYSEKNMLLNHELSSLKKKIDALEEDTLLKDGQISILKDSLNKGRPFDVLFGDDQEALFKL
ncbi:uncharacterized protein LOC141599941 [Silene latifolia]|uniref:uncharacterized protein LOC141599941 n=1 Tax=Silene latifolia TaxID=37657 RepID=UPI003D789DAA